MTSTFAFRTASLALAALMTSALLAGTDALAAHQFHVAEAQRGVLIASVDMRQVTAVGDRVARA